MTRITQSTIVPGTARYQGLLELDMDVNAERFVVFDRRSFMPLYSGIRPPSGIAKVLMPQELTTAGYCLVGIVDDGGQYNAKFLDGVQLQLVNALTVDMSQ
ncbi:hypothetical protein [Shewanella algae]|uniref:hypothetical protein n=1 Tax=Shewanella algae TaxID=38313 RepID=UPI0031F5A408